MLKVSPWKGVMRFGQKGKLSPRYIGPFEIIERIGSVAYRLKLPTELSGIHDVFHISNLKKCLVDESLAMPHQEVEIDEQLRFTERPVAIVDRQKKKLRKKKIPMVKVKWDSQRGPEYTWNLESDIRAKHPHLFKRSRGRDHSQEGEDVTPRLDPDQSSRAPYHGMFLFSH
jgi:hypothetical protein